MQLIVCLEWLYHTFYGDSIGIKIIVPYITNLYNFVNILVEVESDGEIKTSKVDCYHT